VVVPEAVTDGPLRILLFLPDMDGGGAQRTFVNLANILPRARIEPTLAAARIDGHARHWLDENVPLHDLNSGRLRWALGPLRRLVRQQRPDALVATIADANAVAWLAVQGLSARPKLILRETNSHRARADIGPVRRTLIGCAYRRADAVIALSEGVRQEITADYRLEPTCTHTIPNAVDVANLYDAVRLVREGDVPTATTGPMIVAMGRLTRQKGFDILLDAFAGIAAKDARLTILGEGDDRIALETRARELGIAERVSLPGFVGDIAPWLAHADLFVLSSRWEGFGHVIVEAMAAGLPVIATDCPYGPGEILCDGETGLLVPPENPHALGAAINRVLSDSELGAKLRKNAATASARYALSEIAERYATLIEETVIGNG
jgi:glycosyltransferase involved in cell wall biosynthesis